MGLFDDVMNEFSNEAPNNGNANPIEQEQQQQQSAEQYTYASQEILNDMESGNPLPLETNQDGESVQVKKGKKANGKEQKEDNQNNQLWSKGQLIQSIVFLVFVAGFLALVIFFFVQAMDFQKANGNFYDNLWRMFE